MPLLRLFGHPAMDDADSSRPLGVPAKAIALIALVVAKAPRPLLREWLAETLWPDTDVAEARTNLRRHLHLALKAIGEDAFVLTRQTVQWNAASATSVDVIAFESLLQANAAAAADHYTGDFCAGIMDEALDDARLRYRSRYEQALHDLLSASKAAGDDSAARTWLQRLISYDPFDEHAVRELMSLRRSAGDRAGAIREYNALAHRLSSEMNVEPEPETVSLFTEIVAENTPSPTPNNLVNATTTFVGRGRELSEIRSAFGKVATVVLVGPGGIGKSRLAIRAAFDLLGAYHDGVWFVDLEHARGEVDIWQGIAQACGMPSSDVPKDAVLHRFSNARTLVVLDTCEHVADGAGNVMDVLGSRTAAHTLATTRRHLSVAHGHEIELRALDVPPSSLAPGDSPLRYSAYRLFMERAAMVSPAFAVESRNVGSLADLLRSIDGLPLAIELVASRANMLTVNGMRRRLGEALRTARTYSGLRNRTMDAALTWSYNLLSPAHRELFAALAVFRGSFTPEDALSVCTHISGCVELLFELADASLVSVVNIGDDMRYRLLETTRGFALQKLLDEEQQDRIFSMHAEHYAAKADSLSQEPDSAFSALLSSTSLNIPDYLAALDYAADHTQAAVGLRILEGLHRFGIRQHFTTDLLARALLLGELPDISGAQRARIARLAGMLAEQSGSYATSIRQFEIAVAYYREAGDESKLCDALTGIAVMAYHLGRYEECENRFLEIRERSERIGDTMLLIKTLGRLGALYLSQAQFEKAMPLLESAVTRLGELGEVRQRATAVKNLGTAAYYLERHEEAIAWLDQAIDLCRLTSEAGMQANALCTRGGALRELNRLSEAIDSFLAATSLLATLTDPTDLIECLEDVISTLAACEDYENAARLLGFCDALREEIGSPINPGLRFYYDRSIGKLQSALGPTFGACHAIGAADSRADAFRLAVQALTRLRAEKMKI